MVFELRYPGDTKMLSPDRDLKHFFKPVCRAAVTMAVLAFEDDEEKMKNLCYITDKISMALQEAKLPESGTVMDVLEKFINSLQGMDPEVLLVVQSNLMYMIMLRYVHGMRETNTEKELDDQDIFEVSVSACIAAHIPKENREAFKDRMRDRGKWGPLDNLSRWERHKVDKVPEDALRKAGQQKEKTNAKDTPKGSK